MYSKLDLHLGIGAIVTKQINNYFKTFLSSWALINNDLQATAQAVNMFFFFVERNQISRYCVDLIGNCIPLGYPFFSPWRPNTSQRKGGLLFDLNVLGQYAQYRK